MPNVGSQEPCVDLVGPDTGDELEANELAGEDRLVIVEQATEEGDCRRPPRKWSIATLVSGTSNRHPGAGANV
jgi:hypothetical protein